MYIETTQNSVRLVSVVQYLRPFGTSTPPSACLARKRIVLWFPCLRLSPIGCSPGTAVWISLARPTALLDANTSETCLSPGGEVTEPRKIQYRSHCAKLSLCGGSDNNILIWLNCPSLVGHPHSTSAASVPLLFLHTTPSRCINTSLYR